MYTIPLSFVPSELVGKHIQQISFAANSIVLSTDSGEYINIWGPFSINSVNYDELYPIEHDFGLLILLDKIIIDATVTDSRKSLNIVFENNNTLILTSNDKYESFLIKTTTQEILI